MIIRKLLTRDVGWYENSDLKSVTVVIGIDEETSFTTDLNVVLG